MIIEDGVFWYVPDDDGSGAVDPLAGIDRSYVSALEAAYGQYCHSVKIHQSILACHGQDLDDFVIAEGKSIGDWGGAPRRVSYGRKIRNNAHYRRIVKQESSSASREFHRKVSKFGDTLRSLVVDYQQDKRPMSQVRRVSAEAFKGIYTAAWEAGRKASGLLQIQKRPRRPTREEESWFRSAVREELSFWQSFLDELDGESFEEKNFTVGERVEMYVKTVWTMYHAGRLSGMPEAVLLHWYPKEKRSGKMCPGCVYMVKMSPFTRDNMPTTPRAGDTPCLMRCVHRVVVRHVTQAEVDKRRAEMPTKQEMLQDLRRIMRGKRVHKRRKISKSYNPWLGQTTWGELK